MAVIGVDGCLKRLLFQTCGWTMKSETVSLTVTAAERITRCGWTTKSGSISSLGGSEPSYVFFSAFNPLHLGGFLPILCDNLSLIAGTVCGLVRQLPHHGFQF